eukprot:172013-Prymnesium_polylepis.1
MSSSRSRESASAFLTAAYVSTSSPPSASASAPLPAASSAARASFSSSCSFLAAERRWYRSTIGRPSEWSSIAAWREAARSFGSASARPGAKHGGGGAREPAHRQCRRWGRGELPALTALVERLGQRVEAAAKLLEQHLPLVENGLVECGQVRRLGQARLQRQQRALLDARRELGRRLDPVELHHRRGVRLAR